MKHTIRKEIIEISIQPNQGSFGIQNQLGRMNESIILPLLQTLFDQIATDEEMIIIDVLEINLGSITSRELDNETLPNETSERIRDQVIKQLKDLKPSSGVRKLPTVTGLAFQWLYFMENGFLPWNSFSFEKENWIPVLETLAIDFECASRLRKAILASDAVSRRIIYQHTPEFLVKLIGILTASKQDSLILHLEELTRLSERLMGSHLVGSNVHSGYSAHSKRIWEKALLLAAKGKNPSFPELLKALITELLIEAKDPEASDELHSNDLKTIGPIISEILKDEKMELKVTDNKTPDQKTEDVGESNLSDGVYIELAGLVLLHPFLLSFYSRLGFVLEKKWKDETSQIKAVQLLYYIATGLHESPEEFLVLPKILCGMSLQVPVEREMNFTWREFEEADDLLLAVIQQWTILKNTTIQGLRESFIQRKGKIIEKPDHMLVQVESRSFDMLLDHLPWNLSFISLPWRRGLIRVEWR